LCLPISRICSAPSRLAASTAHSPTAPSPITVTVVRGPILALTAAWWPAGNTSDRVSSDGGTPSADGLNLLASWAATLEAAGSAPGQPGQAR